MSPARVWTHACCFLVLGALSAAASMKIKVRQGKLEELKLRRATHNALALSMHQSSRLRSCSGGFITNSACFMVVSWTVQGTRACIETCSGRPMEMSSWQGSGSGQSVGMTVKDLPILLVPVSSCYSHRCMHCITPWAYQKHPSTLSCHVMCVAFLRHNMSCVRTIV